jgi:hypothetical protein
MDDVAKLAPANPKRITKKVLQAIDKMVTGGVKNITDAAILVGLSREHLSRQLNKPHIAEFMRQEVLRSLTVASARAGAVKTELLESGNAVVADRASSFILGLSGIQPQTSPTVALNISIKAGYVIDLSEDPQPKVIDPIDF